MEQNQERKTILDVEGQKEIIDYSIKKSMSYVLKIFLIVFPIIIISAGLMVYIAFKFINIL
jgi:hypothetical protein